MKKLTTIELIDRGGMLDTRIKKLDKELKEIKAELKAIAEEKNTEVLLGKNYAMTITPSTTTKLTAEKLYNWIIEQKQALLWHCFKVDLTSARKSYGDLVIDGLGIVENSSPRLTFKKR